MRKSCDKRHTAHLQIVGGTWFCPICRRDLGPASEADKAVDPAPSATSADAASAAPVEAAPAPSPAPVPSPAAFVPPPVAPATTEVPVGRIDFSAPPPASSKPKGRAGTKAPSVKPDPSA